MPDPVPVDPLPEPRRPRLPWVAPLVVLGVLTAVLATSAPVVAPAAFPWCSRNAAVPAYAYDVEAFVRSHNGSPPKGYVGGRQYQDRTLKLPPWDGPFREYDVHANVPGQKRDDERHYFSRW